jgi:transposase
MGGTFDTDAAASVVEASRLNQRKLRQPMNNGQGRAILSVPFERSDFYEQAHFSIIERCAGSLETASLFRRVQAGRCPADEGYSIPAAANACGVSDQTVRNWYGRIAPAPEPAGDEATVEELSAEVARLRKQLRRAELERAILEKATARRRRFDCPVGAFAKDTL